MNQKKFAVMIGVTPQRISQLKTLGLPGVSSYGQGRDSYVDVGQAIPWLLSNGYLGGSQSPGSKPADVDVVAVTNAVWNATDEATDNLADFLGVKRSIAYEITLQVLISAYYATLREFDLDDVEMSEAGQERIDNTPSSIEEMERFTNSLHGLGFHAE